MRPRASVHVEHFLVHDYYGGTQEQLIACGIPAEWFPTIRRDDRGRMIRSYAVEGVEGVSLRLEHERRWGVYVNVPEEEADKRRAERAAAYWKDRQAARTKPMLRLVVDNAAEGAHK